MNRAATPDLPRSDAPRRSIGTLMAASPNSATLRRLWNMVRLTSHTVLLIAAVVIARVSVNASPDGSLLVWLMPPLVLSLLAARGTYRRSIQLDMSSELARVLVASSIAAVTLIAAASLINHASDPAPFVVRVWICAAIYFCIGVPLLIVSERRARRSGADRVPTLVVGRDRLVRKLSTSSPSTRSSACTSLDT